jgi:hypothetical protein
MQEVVALWASWCLCPKLAIYEKDGFSANPAAMATCRGTVSCISIFNSHNSASQGQQPTPGELIGEGARPVFDRPQGDRPRTRK